MADRQASACIPSDESPAQRQARLRRERREAKIKAGGSTRLDKITQLSGRSAEEGADKFQLPTMISYVVFKPISVLTAAVVPPPPPSSVQDSSAGDPEEADISSHAYPIQPSSRNSAPTEADIRQLLRSAPPQQGAQPGPDQQRAGGEDDPMMQMLQQMMGSMPGAEGGEQGGLPPGLAALLGGGAAAGGPGTAGLGQRGEEENVDGYLWRILHAMFAFLLGIYMTAVTTFNGALFLGTETTRGGGDKEIGYRLFWIFATAEVVLQSSRYVLEKGKTSQAGWMGMVLQVLPEPWKTYAGLVARYSGIWTTVVEDAMVVVFVLGCVAWWKGAVS
ncbi:MAG: hypothetical protein Q9186_002607 [Xanthomendoza sp. 1 TL-2023]